MMMFVFTIGLMYCNVPSKTYKVDIQNCDQKRSVYKELENKKAVVSFIKNKGLYALQFSLTDSKLDIDTTTFGIVCDLPTNFQDESMKVTFSGILLYLTEAELQAYKPLPSGTKVLFLKITEINNQL
jgi:hypothetical protein